MWSQEKCYVFLLLALATEGFKLGNSDIEDKIAKKPVHQIKAERILHFGQDGKRKVNRRTSLSFPNGVENMQQITQSRAKRSRAYHPNSMLHEMLYTQPPPSPAVQLTQNEYCQSPMDYSYRENEPGYYQQTQNLYFPPPQIEYYQPQPNEYYKGPSPQQNAYSNLPQENANYYDMAQLYLYNQQQQIGYEQYPQYFFNYQPPNNQYLQAQQNYLYQPQPNPYYQPSQNTDYYQQQGYEPLVSANPYFSALAQSPNLPQSPPQKSVTASESENHLQSVSRLGAFLGPAAFTAREVGMAGGKINDAIMSYHQLTDELYDEDNLDNELGPSEDYY